MEIREKSAGIHSTKLMLMEGETELGFLIYCDKRPPREDYMEILYFRVNPSHRKKGYGKILMDEFFRRIYSYVGDVRLYATSNYDIGSLHGAEKDTQISQADLEAFYGKYGFKKVDPSQKLYPIMIMTKS